MSTRTPRPPADLGDAGRTVWRELHRWLQAQNVLLDPHEDMLLAELCRTSDRLQAIREAITGLRATSETFAKLAVEERQQRLALGRLVSALGLPTGLPATVDGGGYSSPKARRAAKAARSRWDRVNRDAS